MVVRRKAGVVALQAHMAPSDMHKAALWVDYGEDYWSRVPPVSQTCVARTRTGGALSLQSPQTTEMPRSAASSHPSPVPIPDMSSMCDEPMGPEVGIGYPETDADHPDEATESNRNFTRNSASSPFGVDQHDQAGDPKLYAIMRALDADVPLELGKGDDLSLYRMDAGSLRRGTAICVPDGPLQLELMYYYHFTVLSGHRNSALYPTLSKSYYWSTIKADCEKFLSRCGHCHGTAAARHTAVPMGSNPMPSEPFKQINIDLKGPLPESGGHKYILVAVDALTRYTLYVPLPDKRGETIFRALLNNVFSLFGMPYGMTVVSDNGTEFKNSLQEEMSQFLGYRKIAVLPWNPTANSLAESAVKRIKNVLDRHTTRYRDWHKILPLAQYMLNSTMQSGISPSKDAPMTPFFALFGRDAPQIPELENPVLRRSSGEGSVYLESLAERLRTLHAHVKELSDGIREARRTKANALIPKISLDIQEGDVVYLLYHNHAEAARIRKSGHGNHWRHRYRVLAVRDYSVKLEAMEGSPALDSWQPIHKVSKSPPELIDDACSVATDAYGCIWAPHQQPPPVLLRTQLFGDPEREGPPPDADGHYEVETIVKAYKSGKRWKVLVKWAGYTELTEEPRSEILQGCTPLVKQLIREACAAAILSREGPDVAEPAIADDEESDEEETPGECSDRQGCFQVGPGDNSSGPMSLSDEVNAMVTLAEYERYVETLILMARVWEPHAGSEPSGTLRLRGKGHGDTPLASYRSGRACGQLDVEPTNPPLRTRPARGQPVINHASFPQVCTVRRDLVGSDASNVRLLTAAYVARSAVVIKGMLTKDEKVAISNSWSAFATAHCAPTYSTYAHAKRSLAEVWGSELGMRMETSLRELEGNPVETWLSQAKEPAVQRLYAKHRRLMQLGASLSKDVSSMRHPAFVTGRISDGAGSTHYDDYHNFALMAVGCKVFYISKSTGGSPVDIAVIHGEEHERRGVNPYNSTAFAPLGCLQHVSPDEWTVAVLEPGDVLYLPKGDWHWVYSDPNAVMTNVWFGT